MYIKDLNIGVSDTCSYLANKYKNSTVINFRQGKQIIDFFSNTDKDFSLLILGEASIISDVLPDVNKDTAFTYYSLQKFLLGSVRDDFDFGKMIIINNTIAKKAVTKMDNDTLLAGFYDFRLQLSRQGDFEHLSTPFYNSNDVCNNTEKEHFAYCMPSNREYQKEAEKIFTKYLRDIDCLISPIDTAVEDFDSIVKQYPVTASVVIPVKDRPEVIGDALKSALHQQTNFPYNVIVVLNQSGEATKNIVADYAKHNSKVVMIENEEPDIKIGGCWNIAINSKHCGAFAIQLDSDDVYSSPNVLSQIVDTFMNEKCGVLIGSYRITDINLNPLSDTIIDHREYTPQNGVNNALRVNGFGAPRCYLTELVRKNQFKNESYGEDYDLCLRLSRQYKLSRIFDVLYLCRRWGKNSDSNLTPERMAQLNYAKDTFRTNEMLARMI
jgi:hypothetical protein